MVKPRHAIVLVHGQGEQRPMEMGPQFVEYIFKADFDPATASSASDPQIRWIAEDRPGIDDQRRIEVRFGDARPDFDVFELYWAPLMGDNKSSHFLMWFFGLLQRPRRDIPKRVRRLHLLTIMLIWAMLLFAGFYLYTTFSALMPVQIVQIAAHGIGDILQFSFDWRLATVLSGLMLFVAAAIAILIRNYGWCVSFLVACIFVCLISPPLAGSGEEISGDVYFLQSQEDTPEPAFNIWGLSIDEKGSAKAGPVSSAAASVSRYLCRLTQDEGEDVVQPPDAAAEADRAAGVRDDIHAARRNINLSTNRPLAWDDMLPNRGAQLKDICLAPVAVTNPVLFARVADSAYILLSTLIIVFAVLFYCIWRSFLEIFIVDIMGDSARYLNSHPKNNIARHNVRQSGLTLLRALHESGRYDRTFVVAHSLGSIVAYDALRQYWGQVASLGIAADPEAVANARGAAAVLDDPDMQSDALDAWQDAQHRLFASLGGRWPISDFVTLGSPLSHGRLLLESSPDAVHASGRFVSQRDVTGSILACPPVERAALPERLSATEMFLAVRWTNLYFDDDVVGGTVSVDADGLLFGKGVKDLEFKPGKQKAPGLSHNSYWLGRMSPTESGGVPWLEAIRTILGVNPAPDG